MRKFVLATALLMTIRVDAQNIKLQAPTTINIPVTSDSETLRVFYTAATGDPLPNVTDVGKLKQGTNVIATRGVSETLKFVDIGVKGALALMKPGETFTGALVFAGAESFAVTVARPKVAFTATPVEADLCLLCDDPRVLTVLVTNTGTFPIANVEIGVLRMSDAARHHRWILPAGAKCAPATIASDDLVLSPCGAGKVAIAPGEHKTVSLQFDQPSHAGDYSAIFEVTADGSQPVSVTAIVRTRGPRALFWFLLLVAVGAAIAHALEAFFGTGGGQVKSRALLSLHSVSDALKPLVTWAGDNKLEQSKLRIASDLSRIESVVRNASTTAPATLEQEAQGFAEALEKRRRLHQKVEYAKANNKAGKLPDLDKVEDSGTADAYDARLTAVLNAPDVTLESTLPPPTAADQKAAEEKDKKRIRRRLLLFDVLRWLTLAIVSILTAFLALYYGKCSFGSAMDYITTFLWGLGLTQAGNALIGEARSRYTRPAGSAG